jgi:hypothetical protein
LSKTFLFSLFFADAQDSDPLQTRGFFKAAHREKNDGTPAYRSGEKEEKRDACVRRS